MKRIKLTKPSIQTPEQASAAVAEIAQIQLDLNESIIARDRELAAVQQQYGPLIEAMETTLKEKTELLQPFAEQDRETWGKLKSRIFPLGTIGFRTGTPKVKQMAGWTVKKTLEAVEQLFPWLVRTKKETDKELLLSEFAQGKLAESDLRTIGVRVVQEESFFIEPNLTELKNRQTVEIK